MAKEPDDHRADVVRVGLFDPKTAADAERILEVIGEEFYYATHRASDRLKVTGSSVMAVAIQSSAREFARFNREATADYLRAMGDLIEFDGQDHERASQAEARRRDALESLHASILAAVEKEDGP